MPLLVMLIMESKDKEVYKTEKAQSRAVFAARLCAKEGRDRLE